MQSTDAHHGFTGMKHIRHSCAFRIDPPRSLLRNKSHGSDATSRGKRRVYALRRAVHGCSLQAGAHRIFPAPSGVQMRATFLLFLTMVLWGRMHARRRRPPPPRLSQTVICGPTEFLKMGNVEKPRISTPHPLPRPKPHPFHCPPRLLFILHKDPPAPPSLQSLALHPPPPAVSSSSSSSVPCSDSLSSIFPPLFLFFLSFFLFLPITLFPPW